MSGEISHLGYYQSNTQEQPGPKLPRGFTCTPTTPQRRARCCRHGAHRSPAPAARCSPRCCRLATHTAKPPRRLFNKHLLILQSSCVH